MKLRFAKSVRQLVLLGHVDRILEDVNHGVAAEIAVAVCTFNSTTSRTDRALYQIDAPAIALKIAGRMKGVCLIGQSATNAVCCDRQSVSEQLAIMWTVSEFPPLCVILYVSIDAILFFSPCRGSAHDLCAVWQRIFCSGVVCGMFSRSLWNVSRRFGRFALLLEQSGVASPLLFRQQPPPLRRQQRRAVLLCYRPRLRR